MNKNLSKTIWWGINQIDVWRIGNKSTRISFPLTIIEANQVLPDWGLTTESDQMLSSGPPFLSLLKNKVCVGNVFRLERVKVRESGCVCELNTSRYSKCIWIKKSQSRHVQAWIVNSDQNCQFVKRNCCWEQPVRKRKTEFVRRHWSSSCITNLNKVPVCRCKYPEGPKRTFLKRLCTNGESIVIKGPLNYPKEILFNKHCVCSKQVVYSNRVYINPIASLNLDISC